MLELIAVPSIGPPIAPPKPADAEPERPLIVYWDFEGSKRKFYGLTRNEYLDEAIGLRIYIPEGDALIERKGPKEYERHDEKVSLDEARHLARHYGEIYCGNIRDMADEWVRNMNAVPDANQTKNSAPKPLDNLMRVIMGLNVEESRVRTLLQAVNEWNQDVIEQVADYTLVNSDVMVPGEEAYMVLESVMGR